MQLDSGWELIWSGLIRGLPTFSNLNSVGDLRDSLHLRKNLLRAILGHFNLKESSILNEHVVILLPAAVYALCAGCAPFTHSYRGFSPSNILVDSFEPTDDQVKTDEHEQERLCELFECSVEVLTKIHLVPTVEVSSSRCYQSVCLPRQFRDLLLHEMEGYIPGPVADKETEKKGEEASPFLSKMSQYLLELLDCAVNAIHENSNDLQALGCSGSISDYNLKTTLIASFRSFLCSLIHAKSRDETALDVVLYDAIIQSMERLLKALAELYNQFSECLRSPPQPDLPSSDAMFQISGPSGSNTRIVDMELDVIEDTQDVDILPVGGIIGTGISFSSVKWKLGMISLISSFHSVLNFATWDVLFELMENERDNKVKTMNNMFEMQASVKLDCFGVVVAACQLVATLLSFGAAGKDGAPTALKRESELNPAVSHVGWGQLYGETEVHVIVLLQNLVHLGELVNKVAEFGLLDWSGRVRLIDCFCNFVLLSPQIGQVITGRH
ncbi:unnamed protein product [Dovyalis caffra]|uniref:Uncharacterized protein n=1 Tax=Dovyalis caffra TaxID=77055 RepID=A0AAV1R9B6_9ROSI|nr:unnamed protein product [Dovyalis caffra]